MPITLGTYGPAGPVLELRYFCGDVCPDYGYLFVSLVGLGPAACEAAGAAPHIDGAGNTYVGCVPAELTNDASQ